MTDDPQLQLPLQQPENEACADPCLAEVTFAELQEAQALCELEGLHEVDLEEDLDEDELAYVDDRTGLEEVDDSDTD